MSELIKEVADLKKRLTTGKSSPFVVLTPMDTGVMTQVETVLKAHLELSASKVRMERFSIRTDASKQVLTRQVDDVTQGIRQASMETGLFSNIFLQIVASPRPKIWPHQQMRQMRSCWCWITPRALKVFWSGPKKTGS